MRGFNRSKKEVSVTDKGKDGDIWLTPIQVVKDLGKFDTDPCCPDTAMPWKTATRMITKKENGLLIPWKGRVWLNPPYSDIKPWAKLMIEHNNGIALIPGRSTDTVWCQYMMEHSLSAFFFAGRLLFHYPDGRKSEGKWCNNILLSYGKANAESLVRYARDHSGLLYTNARKGE